MRGKSSLTANTEYEKPDSDAGVFFRHLPDLIRAYILIPKCWIRGLSPRMTALKYKNAAGLLFGKKSERPFGARPPDTHSAAKLMTMTDVKDFEKAI